MNGAIRRTHHFGAQELSILDWDGPAGQTLVFSHANGFNAQTYAELLTPLAGDFRVLACDLRGHGRSTLAATPGLARHWSIFADDLVAFLRASGSAPAVLSGHSLGATASLFAAARAPDVAAALVLVEPVLLSPVPEGVRSANDSLAQMATQRRSTFASLPAALAYYRGRGIFAGWPEAILKDYLEGGLIAAVEGGLRLACAPQWESEIFRDAPLGVASVAARIACPLVILRGSIASTATEREVDEIVRLKPDTRVMTFDGATHFLPIEEPDRVREEIRRLAACNPPV